MTGKPLASCVADFNETEWKHFATRTGDKWTFSIPPDELQIIDDLLPNHVLGVEMTITGPAGEIMCGKLIPKKK
jgi:hypothetical protein